MRIYVGPKDLALLSKVQPSLEDLVQFGWTGIIAKPLLSVLQWMHRYIPNYGWAIVPVHAGASTMALFPFEDEKLALDAEDAEGGAGNSVDSGSLQEIFDERSAQAKDERRSDGGLQREGINPMGSCLPMLMQMPIWWAFYRMLKGAIELRHAPWIWWIHDLSAKDPYYILPIAMTHHDRT